MTQGRARLWYNTNPGRSVTMTFTTINLANDQVLVEGTDIRGNSGSVVLDGTEWNAMQERNRINGAFEKFDESVEAFFAPLVEAAKQVSEAHKVTIDPLLYIVEQEEVQPQEGKSERLIRLGADTVVLRAIALDKTDRLIWVNGTLVVTA